MTGDNAQISGREDRGRMTREFDIIILGGGIAGAAMALALAQATENQETGEKTLDIGLVDANDLLPVELQVEDGVFDPRVCALTDASKNLLDNLGAWPLIEKHRASPYQGMEVWDAGGTGTISFSAAELGVSCLGHIVENSVIRNALLERLQDTQVQLLGGVEVQGMTMEPGESGRKRVQLKLWDNSSLDTSLLIAADGAESRARGWTGIPMREWDYLHHAIVTTVELEKPHQSTAWQIFLDTGPLAFLPLTSTADGRHYCSIVWSLVPDEARRIMAMNDEDFSGVLAQAMEHKFGRIVGTDKRFCHPLRQRHAKQYHRNQVVLIGDAAHTIHPLAGQGANLGLLDVASLVEEIQRACERKEDFSAAHILDRYQRAREGNNLAMAGIMEGLQRLFDSNHLLFRWLRNTGLNLTDRVPVLKQEIVSRAMGLRGDLPKLARAKGTV